MPRFIVDCDEPLTDTEASVLRFGLLRTAREFFERRAAVRARLAARAMVTQQAEAATARLYREGQGQ